ncbi:MAG TPA: murein biosynthesis integral membrane protein MurJ [Acidimicrobiia bacterium]|nr:murein biosynthesis integral membrane protein MurJ [Acidimicrobiia bacterium]
MSTLGRAALVVSAGILASRLLGFLRDVVLAGLLGRGVEADLYNFAFAIPDYLFFLMAGGYLSITLVPILSRHLAQDDLATTNRAFTSVFRFVAGLMMVATVVTMVAAPALVRLVYPEVDESLLPDLVGYVRIILPAQLFFVLGALLMAYQYTHRRFLIPTLAPIIYNLGIIAGGLAGAAAGQAGPGGFVWGALIGAVAGNFALQWWGARRDGMRLQAPSRVWNGTVREYLVLALPLMLGQSAVALDEFFVRVFGQFAGEGATAGLGYARRVTMVPVGVIAQAAGVASFPFLAGLFAEGRMAEMRRTVGTALRSSLMVAGLGAAGVIGLALPIIRLAYQRGEFSAGDSSFVAGLLVIYGFSIPMWAAHQVYTRAFYAQRRMWLPVVVGTVTTIVAIPAYIWAANRFGAEGIAAVSVGAMLAYTAAMGVWWHRGESDGKPIGASLARMMLAAVPAAAVAIWITDLLDPVALGQSLAALLIGGVTAVAVYAAVLALLRAPELSMLRRG